MIWFRNIAAVILCMGVSGIFAQDPTVGLIYKSEESFEGYTLFAPLPYTVTYLIDHDGFLVNSWESEYSPGNAVYLLEDGSLLHSSAIGGHPIFNSGGSGGIMQRFDWDGTLLWEFRYSDPSVHLHHDMEALPNGNILMIAWEYKTAGEAIAAGRSPQLLPQEEIWPDHIIEVQPTGLNTGEIVWEWHVWDHLVQDHDPTKENYGIVEEHPELVDINYVMNQGPNAGHPDWNHTNGIDYNEEFDQIVLSVRAFSEIWVIDHSTTSEQAAGHSGGNSGMGGDLLYRWGNPEAYRAGDVSDRSFFCQHDAQWISSGSPGQGNILVFNNGCDRPQGEFSTVDEIVTPTDENGNYTYTPGSSYGPDEQTWVYMAENPQEFYSAAISGAERMPNGNTLICSGNWGTLFEVTPEGETVWFYINPVTQDGPLYQGETVPTNPHGNGAMNNVFKTRRYAPDYPGFEGRDLTPGAPVELYPAGASKHDGIPAILTLESIIPNPFSIETTVLCSLTRSMELGWAIHSLDGRKIWSSPSRYYAEGSHSVVWNGNRSDGAKAVSGTYILHITAAGDQEFDTRAMRTLLLIR